MKTIAHKSCILLFFLGIGAFSLTLKPHLKIAKDRVFHQLINSEYQQTLHLTDSLIASDSSEPFFHLLQLITLCLRDFDYDKIVDTLAFLKTYERTIKSIEQYENKQERTSYTMTLWGFAYATHSSFYLLHNKPFSALSTGLDAIKMCRKAFRRDPNNYDAALLPAIYNYGKAELKRMLWMLLFWLPGSKKQGIKTIEICSIKAQIFADVAKIALVDVYAQEKKFAQSHILLDSLLKAFPNSRLLLWNQVKYYEAHENFSRAIDIYDKLADIYSKLPHGDYRVLTAKKRQLELLIKIGKEQEARTITNHLLVDEICSRNKGNKKICKEIAQICKE